MIRSSVAQSFFAPRDTEDVDETSAMSTGRRRTVARSAERVTMVTELQSADRSYFAFHVKTVMMATKRASTMAIAYVTQISEVCNKPAEAMMGELSAVEVLVFSFERAREREEGVLLSGESRSRTVAFGFSYLRQAKIIRTGAKLWPSRDATTTGAPLQSGVALRHCQLSANAYRLLHDAQLPLGDIFKKPVFLLFTSLLTVKR